MFFTEWGAGSVCDGVRAGGGGGGGGLCDRGGNTGTVSALYLSRASPSHMAFAFCPHCVVLCVYVCMCLFVSHTNVQASVIPPMCVSDDCVSIRAQACQLGCASSVERSSQSDHEGYF